MDTNLRWGAFFLLSVFLSAFFWLLGAPIWAATMFAIYMSHQHLWILS